MGNVASTFSPYISKVPWVKTTAPSTLNWISVASSADGTKLFAVGIISSTYSLWYSNDSGSNWKQSVLFYKLQSILPLSENDYSSLTWTCIKSNSAGTILVAGTSNKGIWYSNDSGINWNESSFTGGTTTTSYNWSCVACDVDGAKFIAGHNFGIAVSNNSGNTWDLAVGVSGQECVSLASSADGKKLVGNFTSGINNIYISSDSGVNWTQISAPSNIAWRSVASSADGSKIVAVVFNGGIWCSNDSGANWKLAEAPTANAWESVVSSADGTKIVATVLAYNSSNGGIVNSYDSGVVFMQSGALLFKWKSVASSSDGTKLVAVVDGGGIYTCNIYSAWSTQAPPLTIQQGKKLLIKSL